MLYDPKWEVQTKTDPFTIVNLIAWLERQPARKDYCFQDNGGCLLFHYFKSCGFTGVCVGGLTATLDGRHVSLTDEFLEVARTEPHTFGAALARARAFVG